MDEHNEVDKGGGGRGGPQEEEAEREDGLGSRTPM